MASLGIKHAYWQGLSEHQLSILNMQRRAAVLTIRVRRYLSSRSFPQ